MTKPLFITDCLIDFDALREATGTKLQNDNYEGCALCGRPVKRGIKSPNPLMHFVGGGMSEVYDINKEWEDKGDDMGFFEIGPDCAKRIKKVLGADYDRFVCKDLNTLWGGVDLENGGKK